MYYFIVNPVSRSGKGHHIWEKIESILTSRHIEYEAYLLSAPGEARELASFISSKKTPCTVVIVGGDGTINDFLSGLPTYQGITLGYIPTGSGNDFARGMHIPSKLEDALDLILAADKIRSINIGCTVCGDEKHYFAISSGFGYDAEVCYYSDNSASKQILNTLHAGKLVYLTTALRRLASLKPFSVRLILDNQQILSYNQVLFVAAMNTRYEGGGFMFCPKASPVDDKLDVIIVEGISKLRALRIIPTAFKGKHTRFKGIHIIRCKRAVVQSDAEQCLHTDGEHAGFHKKACFELVNEKIRLIVD